MNGESVCLYAMEDKLKKKNERGAVHVVTDSCGASTQPRLAAEIAGQESCNSGSNPCCTNPCYPWVQWLLYGLGQMSLNLGFIWSNSLRALVVRAGPVTSGAGTERRAQEGQENAGCSSPPSRL